MYGKAETQIMAPLPVERLKPAPPWFFIGLDLFGPFKIRGEVNKRTIGKAYGIIFTCLLTRAIHLDLSADYSMDAFLMSFRRFVPIRGCPKKIFSDSGSQLVAASKELRDMFKNNLDWVKIKDNTSGNGVEWSFSPGEAPWYKDTVRQ